MSYESCNPALQIWCSNPLCWVEGSGGELCQAFALLYQQHSWHFESFGRHEHKQLQEGLDTQLFSSICPFSTDCLYMVFSSTRFFWFLSNVRWSFGLTKSDVCCSLYSLHRQLSMGNQRLFHAQKISNWQLWILMGGQKWVQMLSFDSNPVLIFCLYKRINL